MSDWIINKGTLIDVANAIRVKKGESGLINVSDLADEILEIEGGTGSITPSGDTEKWVIDSDTLADIADAIREKRGTSGTILVSELANQILLIGQSRPVVPKTGTWQFKTTPTKGFIILGHDDDTSDSAKFVRMIDGYGYPVVLNTTWQNQNSPISADVDTQTSLYPAGTTALFPNGGTILDLNQYILANNMGEVAQHGGSSDALWDSTLLTGDVLDTMYATYTTGGGTKTKAELKEAIMDTYSETDVAQDAPRVMENRLAIENLLGDYIYTIGIWGGSTSFVIDGITVGSTANVSSNQRESLDRENDYMGDGILTWQGGAAHQNPWHTSRQSGGLNNSETTELFCQRAYDSKCCVELFHHYYIDESAEHWQNFKDCMDVVKSYVDQGKISVVTRKQYYELGEIVADPIVGLSVTPDAVSYSTNTVLTAANFTCKAILDSGSEVVCANDRILDLSNIDTSTEGNYTAYLEYRGKSTSCTVVISDAPPVHYLLENASFSGLEMESSQSYGDISPTITFEANKTYEMSFNFSAETTVQYSQHYIQFEIGEAKRTWIADDPRNYYQLDSVSGVTTGACVVRFTTSAAKTISKFVYCRGLQNTTVGAWSITNAYIYEVATS